MSAAGCAAGGRREEAAGGSRAAGGEEVANPIFENFKRVVLAAPVELCDRIDADFASDSRVSRGFDAEFSSRVVDSRAAS